MKNIFEQAVSSEVIDRINKLTPSTQHVWGKMNVAQMLAHCNVTYEIVYEDKHPRPNAFMRFFIKLFVKNLVIGEKPYKKDLRTAPQFLIVDEKDFESEKARLISNIQKTQQHGAAYFEGKENPAFGPLTSQEWNNLFYKHIDHHLMQFGV